ncbi:hypothetical protein HDZ31DRAFT_70695 [Schizophyllum fasciatum]
MENPHAERQAALLQRILKNVSKCNEAFHEVNTCMDVRKILWGMDEEGSTDLR